MNNKNKNDYLTVEELNEQLKYLIKNSCDMKLKILGEVTNYKISRSHLYFTLKDLNAKISVVSWNFETKFPNIKIDNGDKIIVHGYLNYWSKAGNIQINAHEFEHLGKGDLHIKYIKLKEKFETKGYFSDVNKKSLPKHIEKVGIITAKEGQALKDFMYILNQKNFHGKLFIKGCFVQGQYCPKSISQALIELDKMDLDVIVLTRGGGSYEDLFGFSSKEIIETLFKLKTCTISAIGHEGDFMLSDFAADIRAPTPSLAGELVSSHQNKIYDTSQLENDMNILKLMLMNNFRKMNRTIDILDKKLYKLFNVSNNFLTKLENYGVECREILKEHFQNLKPNLDNKINKYNIINPSNILEKGYVILVDNNETFGTISTIEKLCEFKSKKGKKLKVKMKNGYATFNISYLKVHKYGE